MKKFKVSVPYNYVSGYLRYGHGEAVIEAEDIEKAEELAYEFDDYELVIDDYSIDDCGNLDFGSIEIEEIVE